MPDTEAKARTWREHPISAQGQRNGFASVSSNGETGGRHSGKRRATHLRRMGQHGSGWGRARVGLFHHKACSGTATFQWAASFSLRAAS